MALDCEAIDWQFIDRFPKSLCGLSIDPTVFFRISGFCALYSRICDPRCCCWLLVISDSLSKSIESFGGYMGCDRCTALGPANVATASGDGVRLSSMAPRSDVRLPFSGLAYRRKFSSFWRLFDFSSSCRDESSVGDRLIFDGQCSAIRWRHIIPPAATNNRMAMAVPHATANRYPESVRSFVIRAVSTYNSKRVWLEGV